MVQEDFKEEVALELCPEVCIRKMQVGRLGVQRNGMHSETEQRTNILCLEPQRFDICNGLLASCLSYFISLGS